MYTKRIICTAFAVLTIHISIFCNSIRSDILHRAIPQLQDLNSEYHRQFEALLASAVETFAATLSPEEQAAQLFHVSFPNEEYLFTHDTGPAAGGFLFFGFNIPATADDLISQNAAIRNFYNAKGQVPPFYSLDCEGGYVNRLSTVAGRIPAPAAVSKVSGTVSKSYYNAVSRMISAAGFTVNLAPVIETANETNISFLDNRAYGDYDSVETYAGSFITAMLENGLYPVVKHYPGNTDADPHLGLPVLNISEDTYQEQYLTVFNRFLSEYTVGVLAAHTVVPCIDTAPVCLSSTHLGSLRTSSPVADELLVFSDDLLMKALTKNGYPPEKSVVAAVKAGVDVVMFSVSQWESNLEYLLQIAENDDYLQNRIRESCCRILRWKCHMGLLSVTAKSEGQSLSMTVSVDNPFSEGQLQEYCTLRTAEFYQAKADADTIYQRYF